jgi:3-oxoacyl-[acyl-carrier-protein] synthase-3
VDGGPGSTKTVGHLRMNGREVFRHAVQKISGVIEETLVASGYAADEIDLFIPHQANVRILDGIAKKLGIEQDKIVKTLEKHGNTSAASIPLALNQAFEDHRVRDGSLILMEAMGGGFTWGAALARW